jgi:hypothetical protein
MSNDEGFEIISPQPGFQTRVMSCTADIAIIGGSAGAGKSYVLLMEPLRHLGTPDFQCVVFRKQYVQVFNPGGLWDESLKLYMRLGSDERPSIRTGDASFVFRGGMKVKFSHLQTDQHVLNWQGSQIAYIGFDELTHFSNRQFWYMMSRNRSTSGVRPYMRASCNPQGEGWVKDLISWWLYPDDYHIEELAGYPIPERAGVLRWFTRLRETVIWGDSPEDVIRQLPKDIAKNYDVENDIKSFTFIPGTLNDNPALMKKDKGYKGNLLALDQYEQEQLLKGRWKRPTDDMYRMFHYSALQDIFTNSFVPGGQRYMTADIAMEGADKFVVGIWNGWRLVAVYEYPKTMGDEVLRRIRQLAKDWGVPVSNICFDSDGVGNYLKGFLRTAYDFRGNAAPIVVQGAKQDYQNLRAQCYYYAGKIVNEYEMFVETTDTDVHAAIYRELDVIRKTEKSATGKLKIEDKASIKARLGGRSPDYADMIAMRSVFDLVKRGRARKTSSV